MKSDSREIAAKAIERSPEIGGFAVGIVENYGCGIELLRKPSGAAHLPRILHAKIAQPRHVRYLARDALARTLEE